MVLGRSEVALLNSGSLNSDRPGTRLLEARNEDSDDLSILDFTTWRYFHCARLTLASF